MPPPPHPSSPEQRRFEVVCACRLLVEEGLDSGPFGNVSIRIPGSDHCWQNPAGVTFDRLTYDDILRVDAQGRVVEGDRAAHPGEFIHREIYRRRPDVNAIVHTHSPDTVVMSLLGKTIEPFTQVGAALRGDQGLYLGYTGPVRDSGEGRAIAEALGEKSIVIAKNHGLFAAGTSLPHAWWDMVVADLAAGVELRARQVGMARADEVSPFVVEKSRREVRGLQAHPMWDNGIRRLRATSPELFARF